MNEIVDRLATVASGLEPAQQELLLDIAGHLARKDSFYASMSREDHSALDEAVLEADRGEGVSRGEMLSRLDALFARHGA